MPKNFLSAALAVLFAVTAQADPLPSWQSGETKSRIIEFVDAVTDPNSADFVPQKDRIATFDNDGNLWAEKPFYFQFLFAMDELAKRAEEDPTILTSDVLKAAAAGDMKGALSNGTEGLLEVVAASHSGISADEFESLARNWLEETTHPETGRPIIEHVYQPMLELLSYLRDEGFRTFIVSGGGIHFIRAYAEDIYGIPPYQVVGTIGESAYQVIDGQPTIMKTPGIAFIDDKEGKPIGIDRSIGKRPIIASGNSDGDFAMLEWTTAGDGPRLGILLHHTDADREWAYDRDSPVGHLERGLDEGPGKGWLIVDMARDWSAVFPEPQ
ncbi:MAG: HAD family hydrolase [Pseudomonadota bacterium]